MAFLLYTIHILTCLFLIMVVLLQQGKGADLSVFGGGGTMTAFGARGAASLLHKLTVGGFILFIVTTLTIGVFQGTGRGSVMVTEEEEAAVSTPAAPEESAAGETSGTATEEEPAAALPEGDEGAITPAETEGGTADDADTAGESGENDGAGENNDDPEENSGG